MIKVDYANSIVNFSNSLLKHFGVTTFHSTIKKIDEVLKQNHEMKTKEISMKRLFLQQLSHLQMLC